MVQSIIQSDEYEILTPLGWSNFSGLKRTTSNGTVVIVVDDGTLLECTYNHKVKTIYGFTEASRLIEGDKISTEKGWKQVIKAIKDPYNTVYVYDALNVEKNNEYFTNGIVSHNCEFMGSSGTLISGSRLKELVHKVPESESAGLSIYEEPKQNVNYVCVVDVSRGKGLDYSAFQIIDVGRMPYNQVCVYRNNITPPVEFTQLLHGFLKKYNDAMVLIEVNDIGGQVADLLHYDYEYENIIKTTTGGAAGKRISTTGKGDRGVRTSKIVKSVGCSILKLLIEQRQLQINDFETINELSTFSAKGSSYEAEPGHHDDLVMCLVLFAWLSNQKYFKEMTDINTLAQLRERTEEEVDFWMTPFGVKHDAAYELNEREDIPWSSVSW